VQWHPERSYDDDPHSRAIFRALVEAASNYRPADSLPRA
jgi:gamma-glutamyl-gamma-aminobutyrate hydrolase PuuD